MSRKRETYRVARRDNLAQVVSELNTILTRIEDRLDTLEALRGDHFTTQRWEKDFLKEGGI
jgi:hypothetical protein